MARISGVDLPREKRVEIGLTYIYGIGRVSSNKILAKANINPDTRVKDLTDEEVAKIRDIIDEDFLVEGDLRRETALNIKSGMVRIFWIASVKVLISFSASSEKTISLSVISFAVFKRLTAWSPRRSKSPIV